MNVQGKTSAESRFARIALLLAAAVCLGALFGCAAQSQSAAAPDASASDGKADTANSKEAVLHVSALSAQCSFESLRDESDLVASGRYLGKSDPILVIPVVGGIDAAMYYTDYRFEVGDVFKGVVLTDDSVSAQGKSVISVRMKGGVGDRVAIVNDDAPELEQGSDYLLFLYRVLDGLDGNTEGNHYYSFGDDLGIWEKDASGAFSNSEVGSVDMDSLVSMPASNVAPASEQNLAAEDAMIEDVRNRYDSGEIDEETLAAYEELYDASRNGFATVGNADDARAFEALMVESASGAARGASS